MEPNHLQELIQHYGYLAVFVGALLEGETILVMAGFAAHAGYLHLGLVIAVATVGGFVGDQFFFVLGRLRGRQVLARFPSVEAHSVRVDELVRRYQTSLIIGVRFMYGMRVAGPLLLGMSHVSRLRFAALSFLGALVWATLIRGAGHLFGQAVEMFLHDAKRYEALMLGALLLAGIGVWIYRRHGLEARAKRRAGARW
jgi:membrane protein DedA with SNARE-associated domain